MTMQGKRNFQSPRDINAHLGLKHTSPWRTYQPWKHCNNWATFVPASSETETNTLPRLHFDKQIQLLPLHLQAENTVAYLITPSLSFSSSRPLSHYSGLQKNSMKFYVFYFSELFVFLPLNLSAVEHITGSHKISSYWQPIVPLFTVLFWCKSHWLILIQQATGIL